MISGLERERPERSYGENQKQEQISWILSHLI